MENFRFTAFETNGEVLIDEIWNFDSEEMAKKEGLKQINEKGVADKVYRLVNESGKIILFRS